MEPVVIIETCKMSLQVSEIAFQTICAVLIPNQRKDLANKTLRFHPVIMYCVSESSEFRDDK